ncbi:amidase [Engelhardtia mirabilis]|uniref:Glutamyl-tRNA(Gln) amidotransferase subunit A n=1 Tax=Engelhardtia mirabilis TaxID=2528011 RepID=A0A518BLM7_9BACT|nr:Glutamyl-tRNA(Gln) amidotransferase subunit A [Planctomycetes bacterium Pla133]QDV02203.1 Glutamyl-tRNA(Gln) amidotransferase subunit A [Planctomycetes bacterium Pla86]
MQAKRGVDPPQDQDGDSARVAPRTIAAAEELAGIEFSAAEREQMAASLARQVAGLRARRGVALENGLAPATVFDPWLGRPSPPGGQRIRFEARGFPERPAADVDVAFASCREQGHWLRTGQLSSVELTRLYLERIRRLDPALSAVITVTEERAVAAAERADRELAAGVDRGPLHGLPWGAKDLFDTAGIRTTWGAEPFAERVPERDAEVVRRLDAAGAVLIAKTSLGALAYGDRWLDQRTNSPFKLDRGSSGSSAGSASGTAAGLFSFALGTETLGSIVSPSMRCGATGLRPTFGRVSRAGAMALCWSLDKVGPITRCVEDALVVLAAIEGSDERDVSTRAMPLEFDGARSVAGLRVGYDPRAFEGERADLIDAAALAALRECEVELVEYELPEAPYASLYTILNVEAAAAFEELTRENLDDQLTWQDEEAWPNSFRQSWFVPAIEMVQVDRLRRRIATQVEQSLGDLDAVLTPSFSGWWLVATNFTGHPCLCLRAGFEQDGQPRGVTLWGRLAGEGRLAELGRALEERLGVWRRQPELG